jgi:hypothetical protein
MLCPKCHAEVDADATECPSCGVVLAKAAEALDRAFLRRRIQATKSQQPPPEPRSFGWTTVIVIGVLLLVAFGAWQWFTDDTVSDLDKLAVEVRSPSNRPSLDGGYVDRKMLGYLVKIAIAIAIFAAGYRRWKASISP